MSALLTIVAALIAAVLLARLARLVRLPPMVGMIAGGVLVANTIAAPLAAADLPAAGWSTSGISQVLRYAVLAVILLRAGLSLSGRDLRRAGPTAIGLGVLPLLGDAAFVAVGAWLLLGLSPAAAIILGLTVAAISPAIVIPGLVEMLDKGSRGIVKTLLAGAPLDNIAAVFLLGLALSVGAGRAFDVRAMVTALAVLAVIVVGMLLRARAPGAATTLQGRLGRVWTYAQYALFGLIGLAVELGPLRDAGMLLVMVIVLGQLGRLAGCFTATAGASLTARERLACAAAYVPKATIQAAFGSMALDSGHADGPLILTAAVLAIILCAPLGTLTLRWAGRVLLER